MDQPISNTDASPRPVRLVRPDRSQLDPDPRILDDLIPSDHTARLVWEFVEQLDTTPLQAHIKSLEGQAGRPALDPAVLVALWVYATLEGIGEARHLARSCRRDDPFKWLCGGMRVSYHTLSDFRTQHAAWLQEQVTGLVAVMIKEGLVNLNCVGQDGLRVRASAGSDSFHKGPKLEESLQQAQVQWDRLDEEFQRQNPQASAAQKAARTRAARERLERIQRAQEEHRKLAETREKRKKGDGATTRASTTDPEARRMKMPDGGTRPAYNVQFETTLDTLVIVGVDVTNAGNDNGQMGPMTAQVEATYGQAPKEKMIDAGFVNEQDIEQLEERNVVLYMPVKSVEQKQAKGIDPYAPLPEDSPAVAAWRQRMGTPEAKEKYKQRGKCEWTNAQCRNRGLDRVTVRGLAKVKAVVLWHALVHNLLRLVALRAERKLAVV